MKYIFLDVDGTLIGSFDYRIPQSAIEAITKAKENGHKVFVCTGRPPSQIDQVDLSLFNGVICSAGAYVEENQQVIYEQPLNGNDRDKIETILKSYGIHYIIECMHSNYYTEGGRDDFMDMFKNYDPNKSWDEMQVSLGLSKMDEMKDDSIFKITYYANKNETIQNIQNVLKDRFQMVYTKRDDGNMMEIEILINGCNKAEGIKKVIEANHASMNDTIGIGDSMNDYEMIQECNVGIVMGNGCDELKKIATYITDPIHEDGLYNAFKKYDLI